MIFQDPNSSLNPRMTVGAALREVVRFHRIVSRGEVDSYVSSLIAKVGLRADDNRKYPHEFSGGQRQRIGIARALAVQPEFIIADEPVSALDVSIQAQVLNLLVDLREEFSLTMMFVSHDLRVVNHFCDRMLVMYLGFVVEELACQDVQQHAKHPYTQALLGANPIVDPDQRQELTVLEGDVPSPYTPPPGCPFITRCPVKEDRCEVEMPPLVDHGNGQRVACWAVGQ
jgi:oligopeptide/dipeptide ABC transporter ATP-binding protein